MKVKRFFSSSMQDALKKVREDLGADAVILSNAKVDGGIEIVAALDYDETIAAQEQESAQKGDQTIRQQGEPNPSQLARMHAEKHIKLHHEMESAKRRIEGVRNQRPPHSLARPAEQSIDPKRPEWDELSDMRAEIMELKGMLTTNRQSHSNTSPAPASLTLVQRQVEKALDSLCISKSIQKSLVSSAKNQVDFDQAWSNVHREINGAVMTDHTEIIDQGGVVALVGPTGSGKTMTIGKMAARYVMKYGADSIALVTTDRYRIAAHEQLKVFGRILNVPVHAVDETNNLDMILNGLTNKRLVLVDTAGLMHSDACWAEQLQELKMSTCAIKNYLVVSAVGQYQVMCSNYNNYKIAGLAGVIISKVDEAVSLGEVLSFLIDTRLRASYFTDGQRVPEDIHLMKESDLFRMAEALLNSSERWVTIRTDDDNTEGESLFSHSA